jgi:hypothetical protein
MRSEETANGVVVILEGKHHGPELPQKVLHADEVDGQAGRGEIDAGGQVGEAC